MEKDIFDLAIVGGGPAGIAAGIYAARKKIKTLFITRQFHGQSVASENIQNWIGTISISGQDLAKKLEEHLKAFADGVLKIHESEVGEKITKTAEGFLLKTDKGEYITKTVLITTGSHRRKLEIPGAKEFEHKGLTYCATCDAPMFGDMDVAVIGGGNSAFESANQLSAYAKSVTILHRSAEFRADPTTVHKTLANPKIKTVKNVELLEIIGDKFVTGIKFKDKTSGQEMTLNLSGIFVEIGHLPNVELARDLVEIDEHNHIKIDHRTQRTSLPGIWAAGDCTDNLYKQNNIAVGDGIKALEDIYIYLKKNH